MFNHGEESLQDASHLFSTQHPIAHTCVLVKERKDILTYNPSSIRAFINLEGESNELYSLLLFICLCLAAGNQGGELLFQATSEEMIRAYSKVPRHAQVVDRVCSC